MGQGLGGTSARASSEAGLRGHFSASGGRGYAPGAAATLRGQRLRSGGRSVRRRAQGTHPEPLRARRLRSVVRRSLSAASVLASGGRLLRRHPPPLRA